MPKNQPFIDSRGTKIASTIGYAISAIFFFFYGPLLWLCCQTSCSPNSCSDMMGVGMLWAMFSFIGAIILPISLIIDLICLSRLEISSHPLARRIAWLNGSSLLGILTCIVFFSLLINSVIPIEKNCTIWLIQGLILLAFILIPPILSACQNSHQQ